MKTCNERPLTSRPTVRPGSPWSFPQCLVETLPTGLTVVRVPMPGQRLSMRSSPNSPPTDRARPS